MPNVLVLSPNQKRREQVVSLLQNENLAVAHLSDIATLTSPDNEDTHDIMLLDTLAVPGKQVLEVLSWCREHKLPALAVLNQETMEAYNFTQGADDFVLEPLQAKELTARINQLLWRLKGKQGKDILRVGDLAIDQERYEVSVAGRSIVLTFKEYELLSLLASSPGRVFTRDILLSKVWGYDYFGGTRTVDVHIRRLRSKIEDARHTFIETIWNVGYRIKEPND